MASVCRRLDGIPFAIELAAARLSTMSVVDLHARLGQRFRLLTGGSRTALARQRTLQATVDWSYDLLDRREQQVLCLLSVFSGGFDLAAAEAVCAPAVASMSRRRRCPRFARQQEPGHPRAVLGGAPVPAARDDASVRRRPARAQRWRCCGGRGAERPRRALPKALRGGRPRAHRSTPRPVAKEAGPRMGEYPSGPDVPLRRAGADRGGLEAGRGFVGLRPGATSTPSPRFVPRSSGPVPCQRPCERVRFA